MPENQDTNPSLAESTGSSRARRLIAASAATLALATGAFAVNNGAESPQRAEAHPPEAPAADHSNDQEQEQEGSTNDSSKDATGSPEVSIEQPEAPGVLASAEFADTPEKNAELQALAESLAGSMMEMHDGSAGMREGLDGEPALYIGGRKFAEDSSGYYDYDLVLPESSPKREDVRSLTLSTISGQPQENGLPAADNQTLFTASMTKNGDGMWMLDTKVHDSLLVQATDEQSQFDTKAFAQQAVLRAAAGNSVR